MHPLVAWAWPWRRRAGAAAESTKGLRIGYASDISGIGVDPGLDDICRQAEQARAALYQRFRKLFERYDILITPQSPVKQFPVMQNFPTEVNGKPLESYLDWIASSFLITLMSLPAALRAQNTGALSEPRQPPTVR